MPFYLQDVYAYYHADFFGRDFLLMIDDVEEERAPATITKHLEQASLKWGGEVIYVREQVSSYHLKWLIEHKVPFIVPATNFTCSCWPST